MGTTWCTTSAEARRKRTSCTPSRSSATTAGDALRDPVAQLARARVPCTVRATVDRAVRLDAVPHHLAVAMGARRCALMDRAFERIERVARAVVRGHLERFVVVVTADFAFRHRRNLRMVREQDRGPDSGSERVEDVLERIDRIVVQAHLVMQVRSGRAAGGADVSDDIAALDALAGLRGVTG